MGEHADGFRKAKSRKRAQGSVSLRLPHRCVIPLTLFPRLPGRSKTHSATSPISCATKSSGSKSCSTKRLKPNAWLSARNGMHVVYVLKRPGWPSRAEERLRAGCCSGQRLLLSRKSWKRMMRRRQGIGLRCGVLRGIRKVAMMERPLW